MLKEERPAAADREPQGNALSNAGHSIGKHKPQWRKHLLRQRAQILRAWSEAFPDHDFVTGRLHEQERLVADPGWAAAAREYHEERGDRPLVVTTPPKRLAWLRKLMAKDLPLDWLWHELNNRDRRPTPAVTVEALWLCIRERGLKALDEPTNQARLKSCDMAARAELARRIGTLKPDEVAS
jgi:hypothetical protein